MIVMRFGISLENFVFLNKAINQNCTNLFAEESYCVVPVGDSTYIFYIFIYSGSPDIDLHSQLCLLVIYANDFFYVIAVLFYSTLDGID